MHGRLDLLEQLTARCLADAERRGCAAPLFVLLGDYIDRGPDSAGVLAFLCRFSVEHRVVALVGNHDAMMVNTVLGDNDGLDWAANGMASTAISYGHGALIAQPVSADDKRARIVETLRSDQQAIEDDVWLAGLPLVHEDQHRIFVHAGLRPGVALFEQTIEDLLWIRKPFLRSRKSFSKSSFMATRRLKASPRYEASGSDWTPARTRPAFSRLPCSIANCIFRSPCGSNSGDRGQQIACSRSPAVSTTLVPGLS